MTSNENPGKGPVEKDRSLSSSGETAGGEKKNRDAAAENEGSFWSKSVAPFRKAVFRGLAVVMPPLLTIVLFIWAWNTLNSYVFSPIEATARYMIVWSIQDIRSNETVQAEIKALPRRELSRHQRTAYRETYRNENGLELARVGHAAWIPLSVYETVDKNPGESRPTTAEKYYSRFVQLTYLKREVILPLFIASFIILLYVCGRTLAHGAGQMVWRYAEAAVDRVPLIRNVYSSVKQVTDFAFTDNDIQCRRIVALQYPRKGLWSLGFVTGEGMSDIRTAANEPCVTVLVPTSPMPATGFTLTVPKSETVDLNITMDQAIQFCVSCGVVVPDMQNISAKTVDTATQKLQGGLGSAVIGEMVAKQIEIHPTQSGDQSNGK